MFAKKTTQRLKTCAYHAAHNYDAARHRRQNLWRRCCNNPYGHGGGLYWAAVDAEAYMCAQLAQLREELRSVRCLPLWRRIFMY